LSQLDRVREYAFLIAEETLDQTVPFIAVCYTLPIEIGNEFDLGHCAHNGIGKRHFNVYLAHKACLQVR
jgi:hypothetical protein